MGKNECSRPVAYKLHSNGNHFACMSWLLTGAKRINPPFVLFVPAEFQHFSKQAAQFPLGLPLSTLRIRDESSISPVIN